jgi:hypothetical protein
MQRLANAVPSLNAEFHKPCVTGRPKNIVRVQKTAMYCLPVLTYLTKKDVLGERRDYHRRHIDGCVPRWIRGRNSFCDLASSA